MIRGFKDNKTSTAEEWLMDYSLRTGNSIDIKTDLLDMSIKFDGTEVDAFILDIIDNKLVIQLVLPLKEKFDDESNRYKNSYVRKLINSNEFLNRFNQKFVKHIQPTKVHTENYATNDKLWLLSHEEINQCSDFLRSNHECHVFELFKNIDLKAYSQMLLKHNTNGWRLRSTYYHIATDYSRYVGYVDHYGYVYYTQANFTHDGALLPACTIC